MKNRIILILLIFAGFFSQQTYSQNNDPYSVDFLETKIQKFKGMKTSGIIMTAVGIPSLVTGVVLYVDWVSDEVNSSSSSSSSTTIDGRAIGGLALMVVGELLTGGGIVLWAIGGSKSRKYQKMLDQKNADVGRINKHFSNIAIRNTNHGVGIVYRF